MIGMQAFNVKPVADDNTSEAELLAQQVVKQPLIAMTRNAAKVVVRGHKRRTSGINAFTERRQKHLAQHAFRHICRRTVDAVAGEAATDKMLHTGQNLVVTFKFCRLKAANCSAAHKS